MHITLQLVSITFSDQKSICLMPQTTGINLDDKG